MSVYIPGMEMPMYCIDCPFMVSRDGDDCILQSDEANENFENWEQMKAGCPLVHVPDHGRLIDADMLPWIEGKDEQDNPVYLLIKACVDVLPTIIPADKE